MLSDPCTNFNRDGVPQSVRDRCIALGVPADGSYSQLNPQISVTTGGNRELKPETSRSFNLSLAYSPKALQDKKWSSSVDFELAFYDIKLDAAVAALDAQAQLDGCIVGGDDSLCQGIHRTATGTIDSFSNSLLNIGGIQVRGLDLVMSYRLPRKSFGKLRFTSQSSYLLDYIERTPTGEGIVANHYEGQLTGTPERAFPSFKSQLAIGWLYQRLDFTLTTRYINGVTERCRDLADFEGTCSDPDAEDDTKSTNRLRPTVYNDVQVVWSPEQAPRLSVTAGVNNLFNVAPPTCYSCSLNGFNGTTYDVPGIFGYLSATYRLQ